jgi:hypothetical protein
MRCYFHLVSSYGMILDDTGVEVADREAAEAAAQKAIEEIKREDDEAEDDWFGWAINIVDSSDRVLLTIPLTNPYGRTGPAQGRERFCIPDPTASLPPRR